MHVRLLLSLVFAVALVACGDSGESAVSDPTDTRDLTSETATADDGTTDTEAPPADEEPTRETDLVGNPAGTGFVELGDTTYEFNANSACQKIFGAVQAAGPLVGADGNVDSIIPPEDWQSEAQADFEWDPPYVKITIDDVLWQADETMEYFNGNEFVAATPDQSSVVSFRNDGATAEGEANFAYFDAAAGELLTNSGSFGFTCP